MQVHKVIYGDNDMPEIWKRSNAELINGLIGMDLGKLATAGKRSLSSLIKNDENINSNNQFKNMNLSKLLSNQRHY
ncbi:unnamed protein product [Onchocerca flexuosa]|uniref:Uncharacterized protein n=1 Tax=Onchocerca flexuosa TaxID=387005 RepID=A0A183HLP1_9BILA|nr:unnamed protein product [Onchocerca flexuosa]